MYPSKLPDHIHYVSYERNGNKQWAVAFWNRNNADDFYEKAKNEILEEELKEEPGFYGTDDRDEIWEMICGTGYHVLDYDIVPVSDAEDWTGVVMEKKHEEDLPRV